MIRIIPLVRIALQWPCKFSWLSFQGVAESCLAIFLPALVMGNFMVLNLFLALLLNSFNSEELKSRKEVGTQCWREGKQQNVKFEEVTSRKSRRNFKQTYCKCKPLLCNSATHHCKVLRRKQSRKARDTALCERLLLHYNALQEKSTKVLKILRCRRVTSG